MLYFNVCVLHLCVYDLLWRRGGGGGGSVGQSMSDATCLLGQGQGWCYYVRRLGDLSPSVDWDRWACREEEGDRLIADKGWA